MVKIRNIFKVLLLVLSRFPKIASGILCYECINQPSNDHCMKYGKITRCMSSSYFEDSCQTEVRLHRFPKTGQLITKRCKQTRACINNFLQNAANCKPFRDNTVCFCCCHHSRCNRQSDHCWRDYSGAIRPRPDRVADICKSLSEFSILGKLTCTDGYKVGSECEFRSFDSSRKPSFRQKCEKNSRGLLEWKNLPGPPKEISDEEVMIPPREMITPGEIEAPGAVTEPTCTVSGQFSNQRVNCTDENRVGSNCTYECLPGYKLDGGSVITCVGTLDGPVWTDLPPFCNVIECQPLQYREADFLDSGCTNSTLLGSTCNFRCDIGFMLTPFESSTVRCEEKGSGPTSPDWSSPVPICSPLSCASFEVEGGEVSCTNEFFYNSTCSVMCLSGHVIHPLNFSAITCMRDLRWSYSPPTCEAIHCPSYDVPNGNVSCTNDALWESTCTVSCSEKDHIIKPFTFTSATCLRNGSWSHDPPCCAKPCPPMTPVDMIIILDSSSSIGQKYWIEVKKFVVRLIGSVNVGPNSTNFAVFQYHRVVNRVTEIVLNEFDNRVALQRAVVAMPYIGRGTWTGIALDHAAKFSLLPSNGNRLQFHDIVIVITDAQVNREDNPLIPAKMLLEMGAKESHDQGTTSQRITLSNFQVFVIGIRLDRLGRKQFTWKQLESITGNHGDRIFALEKGIQDGLSASDVNKAVTKVVCESESSCTYFL